MDFVFLPDRQSRVTILRCPEFSGSAEKSQFLSLATREELFLPDRQSKVTIVSCPESTERQESLFHLIYQSLVTASFYYIGL